MYIRPDYHEDGVYHVYNRGVAKLPIFLKESDYFDFKQIMRYFLIGFPEPKVSDTLGLPISEFIKRLGITYCHKFNHDNQRVGPIFQGRFKVKEIDGDERVVHTARYIHINPTTAGLADRPEDWKHSDLSQYLNFQPTAPSDNISKPLFVLEYFNRSPKAYRDFVEAQFTEEDSQKNSDVALEDEP